MSTPAEQLEMDSNEEPTSAEATTKSESEILAGRQEIGRILKSARIAKFRNFKAFAKASGLGVSTIKAAERGTTQKRLTILVMQRLTEILGVEIPDELFTEPYLSTKKVKLKRVPKLRTTTSTKPKRKFKNSETARPEKQHDIGLKQETNIQPQESVNDQTPDEHNTTENPAVSAPTATPVTANVTPVIVVTGTSPADGTLTKLRELFSQGYRLQLVRGSEIIQFEFW